MPPEAVQDRGSHGCKVVTEGLGAAKPGTGGIVVVVGGVVVEVGCPLAFVVVLATGAVVVVGLGVASGMYQLVPSTTVTGAVIVGS